MKLVLAGGLLLLAGAALAQDSAPPVGDEFVRLFSSYCLQKFPDDGALAAQALQDKLEPLSPAQVKTIEHKDAGLGWMVSRAGVPYLLTVEQAGLHTCALRRTSDRPLDGAALIAAATEFVEAQQSQTDAARGLRPAPGRRRGEQFADLAGAGRKGPALAPGLHVLCRQLSGGRAPRRHAGATFF